MNRFWKASGLLVFAPFGRPFGLPDWPFLKRVFSGGFP
jgi:hypothetical protein